MAREAQGHGDRLSSLDAAFLRMESPTRHMHVGGLFIFDPPPVRRADAFERFLKLVRSRLHLVPRYRQKVVEPPLGLGLPVWVDDPDFDLGYHVRHSVLPPSGTTAQLTEYCCRILSRQLDRARPLWELYVIEGLEHGRVALLGKSHHAMIDGIAGMDIASVMLDVGSASGPTEPGPASEVESGVEPWDPHPTPTRTELAVDAIRDIASQPGLAFEAAKRAADAPAAAAKQAATIGRGVARLTRTSLMHLAPRSLLNQPPGRHRRFAIQRLPLAEVKRIKNTFRTTVNDVVLALVADATGRYLREQGEKTDGVWLRAMVPVSTRRGPTGKLGNRIVSTFVELPMEEMDPIERLRTCHAEMREVKASHAAVGASFLIGLGDFAPPTLHAMAARTMVNARVYNFLVTNVPGPQRPVYLQGARLLGAFPFTPLGAHHTYGVGVTSIDGWMNVGITADYDAMRDVESVTGHLIDALDELAASADAAADRRHLAAADGDTASQ